MIASSTGRSSGEVFVIETNYANGTARLALEKRYASPLHGAGCIRGSDVVQDWPHGRYQRMKYYGSSRGMLD